MVSVPELNPDVMHLGLERQKSLMLGNLPDFTSLLESLNTPTLKDNFDFASVIANEVADQSLAEQFNFENIESSFYPESQNPMVAQLKNIRMIERPSAELTNTGAAVNYQSSPQQFYQPSSPPSSVPSPCSASGYSSDVNTMGIDNETENTRLTMMGDGFQVKTEPCRTDEAGQITMEEFTKRIDRCCSQLNLPRDPTYWTWKQVQQWAIWTSRECYNYDHTSLQHLQVDGTTLCMLNQEDFVSRIGNKELGEILYIDLDIWKNTLCLEARARQAAMAAEIQCQQQQLDQQQMLHPQQQLHHHQQPQLYQNRVSEADQPVYTDLSHSTAASYTITNIPTPVMTSTDVTLTLNALNQTLSHEMYTASQNCGAYQQMSPCSNLGSSGHGGWEESSDSGTSNYGHDYMMADDEDSRASTPLTNHMPTSTTTTIKKSPVVHKKYGAAIGHTKHTIHLWQFLKELLMSPNLYNNCIRWVDQRKGIFKIEDSTRVARLWGERKNRPAMNYDKLSRSIRQYYKKGIIKKTEQSKRLVYQFCEQYIV